MYSSHECACSTGPNSFFVGVSSRGFCPPSFDPHNLWSSSVRKLLQPTLVEQWDIAHLLYPAGAFQDVHARDTCLDEFVAFADPVVYFEDLACHVTANLEHPVITREVTGVINEPCLGQTFKIVLKEAFKGLTLEYESSTLYSGVHQLVLNAFSVYTVTVG